MPRSTPFRGERGSGVACCLYDNTADHHTRRAHSDPCRRRVAMRTRRASPTARRARLPRPAERRHTDGRSGLSVTPAGTPPDFTRPDQSAPGWGVVEHLADDRLGQAARLETVIPLGADGELVCDEPAERAGVEVLGAPGGQPRACPISSACRPAARPVSLVDHRVPPDRVTGPPAADGPLPRPCTGLGIRRRGSGPRYLRGGGRRADCACGTRVQPWVRNRSGIRKGPNRALP
jgi:hypothetical protein